MSTKTITVCQIGIIKTFERKTTTKLMFSIRKSWAYDTNTIILTNSNIVIEHMTIEDLIWGLQKLDYLGLSNLLQCVIELLQRCGFSKKKKKFQQIEWLYLKMKLLHFIIPYIQ